MRGGSGRDRGGAMVWTHLLEASGRMVAGSYQRVPVAAEKE